MLKILLYDTYEIDERKTITKILNNAYVHRLLPINKLIIYDDFKKHSTSENSNDLINKFNLLILRVKENEEKCKKILEEISASKVMHVILVIDKSVDLQKYISPNLRVSSIIYSPIDTMFLYKRLIDIYNEIIKINDTNNYFKVKNGFDYIILKTSDILYFESVDKKMFAMTYTRSVSFYSNFENLLKQLPEHFIRCHKGYIVNSTKIDTVEYSNMKIILEEDKTIPISRKYKNDLKDKLY